MAEHLKVQNKEQKKKEEKKERGRVLLYYSNSPLVSPFRRKGGHSIIPFSANWLGCLTSFYYNR
jgi:hypothetical protein